MFELASRLPFTEGKALLFLTYRMCPCTQSSWHEQLNANEQQRQSLWDILRRPAVASKTA